MSAAENTLQGTLGSWDSARGFGFIRQQDGSRLFVHHSAFAGQPPAVGEGVSYRTGTGRDGRPLAAWARSAASPAPAAARQQGCIRHWDAARGFGFIETGDGDELFVHVSAFAASPRRPQAGERVYFKRGLNGQGREVAVWAAFATLPDLHVLAAARPAKAAWPWPLWPALAWWLLALWQLPRWAAAAALVLSALLFVLYWQDKRAAQAGRWRTPESTLHLLAMFGGWPGAALAQHWLRHKSAKPGFRRVFWLTVLLNLLALTAWAWPALPAALLAANFG